MKLVNFGFSILIYEYGFPLEIFFPNVKQKSQQEINIFDLVLKSMIYYK